MREEKEFCWVFCGVVLAPNAPPKPFVVPFMLAGPPAGPPEADIEPVEKKFDPPNDESFVFGIPFMPPRAPFGENIGDIPVVPGLNMDARNGLGVPVN